MINNTYSITIDTKQGWTNKQDIQFIQSSAGTCRLEFEIIHNGEPLDQTGKRIMLEVLTPNNAVIEVPLDVSTGKLYKELDMRFISQGGTYYGELSIYSEDNTKLMCTPKFNYFVGANFAEQDVPQSSQYSTLQECIMQTKDVQASVVGNAELVEASKEQATVAATNSIASSQASQSSADSARQTADLVTDVVEMAKASAEASQASAVSSSTSASEAEKAKLAAIQASVVASQASETANTASVNAEQALQTNTVALSQTQEAKEHAVSARTHAEQAQASATATSALLDTKIVEVNDLKQSVIATANVANSANDTANTNLTRIEQLTADVESATNTANNAVAITTQSEKNAKASEQAAAQSAINANTSATTATTKANEAKGYADAAKLELGKVTAEGTKQVGIVASEGTKQVDLAKAEVVKATTQAGIATTKAQEAQVSATQAGSAAQVEVKKHVKLDNESKESFNFIGNKVVQDGLIGISDTNVLLETVIVKYNALEVNDGYILNCLSSVTSKGWGIWKDPSSRKIFGYFNNLRFQSNLLNDSCILTVMIYTRKMTLISDGIYFSIDLPYDYSTSPSGISKGNKNEWVYISRYNRQLTPIEIQHNFSVLNNSLSLKSLETTATDGKKTTILLGSDSDHVEMRTGRTLAQEYMGVLKTLGKEHVSTNGADISVANGVEARVIGAEIQGQTVKQIMPKLTTGIIYTPSMNLIENDYVESVNGGAFQYVKNTANLEAGKTYTLFMDIAENTYQTDAETMDSVFRIIPKAKQVGIIAKALTLTELDIAKTNINYFKWSSGYIKYRYMLFEGDLTGKINSYVPFGLSSTVATISNNGIKYPLYASLEDKAQKKQILLGGVGGVNDKVTLNSDGSLSGESKCYFVKFKDVFTSLTKSGSVGTNTTRWYGEANAPLRKPQNDNAPLLCDKMNVITNINTTDEIGIGTYGNPGNFNFRIPNSITTSSEAIQFINSNYPDMIIGYQLATPVTYTVDKSVNDPIASADKINIFSAGEAVKASSFKVTVPVNTQTELAELRTEVANIKAILNTPKNLSLTANYVEDQYQECLAEINQI